MLAHHGVIADLQVARLARPLGVLRLVADDGERMNLAAPAQGRALGNVGVGIDARSAPIRTFRSTTA